MDINDNLEEEEYVKIKTSLEENELTKIKTQIPKEEQNLEVSKENKQENQLLSSQYTDHKENNSNRSNNNFEEQTKETLNNLFSLNKTNVAENLNKKNLNENFDVKNVKDNSFIINLTSSNIIKNDYDNYESTVGNYLSKRHNELNENEKNNTSEKNSKEYKLDKNKDESKKLNIEITKDKETFYNINKNFSFANKDNSTERIFDQNDIITLNNETVSHKSLHKKCRSKSNIKKINLSDFYFNYKNEELFNNLNSKNSNYDKKKIIDNINNNINHNRDNNFKSNLYSSNNNINTNIKRNVNINVNTNVNTNINTDFSNDMNKDIKYMNTSNTTKNTYTKIKFNQGNIYQKKKLINIENLNIPDKKYITNNTQYFPSKNLMVDENINVNNIINTINRNEEETDFQKNNKLHSKISSINSCSSSVLDSISIRRADEEEKNMRIQIEDEERKLYELEKEKQKLLEEEKERRKIILNAIEEQKQNKKKAKNLIKKNKLEDEKKLRSLYIRQEQNKSEIQKLLNNRQKDEEKLMLIEKKKNQYDYKFYDNNLNENCNDDFFKKIENKHKLSNQKNAEIFRYIDTNIIHNYPQNINKHNFYKNTNENKKYNLTSYFQYKHSPNKNNKYKNSYNLSDDDLSSMNDDANKISNKNIESSVPSIPLTPSSLYRNYKSIDKNYSNVIPNNNSFSQTRLYKRNIILPEEEIKIQQYDIVKKSGKANGNNHNYVKTLNYDNDNKIYKNNFSKISKMSGIIAEFHRKNIENLKKSMKINFSNLTNNFENVGKNCFNYTEKSNNNKNLYSENNFNSAHANSHFRNNSSTKLSLKKGRLYNNFKDIINKSNNYIDINGNINNNINQNYKYQKYNNIDNKSSIFVNKICSPVIEGGKYFNNNSFKINLNENYIPWFNCDSNIATCENCMNERNFYHINDNYETKNDMSNKYNDDNDVLKLCPFCKELYRKNKTDLV